MVLERQGDSRWYLKDTSISGDTSVWLKMIEVASDDDVEFPLPGA